MNICTLLYMYIRKISNRAMLVLKKGKPCDGAILRGSFRSSMGDTRVVCVIMQPQ